MKVAIVTSGGDCAGMNAAVRGVVLAGILKGCETWVVREGYEGLVHGNSENKEKTSVPTYRQSQSVHIEGKVARNILSNLRFGDGDLLRDGTGDHVYGKTLKGRYIVRVGWDDVGGWLSQGGTLIGTARSASFRTKEGRLYAAYNLIKEGIDAMVVCGGDGSLTGADVFRSEWSNLVNQLLSEERITDKQALAHQHLKIVGLVGSIDNDMFMTDLTIGAVTALHRISDAINNIHSTAASHSRAFVIEVMGRHCGWLALLAGIAGGADFVFVPEQPPDAQFWKKNMCDAIHRQRDVGKRITIVIVAEGAIDSDLNPIKAECVKDVLSERLNLDTRVTTLGHVQRGGPACAIDRILATLQGFEAIDALLESTQETPSYMIGIHENNIVRVSLMEAVTKTRAVSEAIHSKNFEKAKMLRNPEFTESLEAFSMISSLGDEFTLPSEKRIRIGIIHVGAPAGGMNAATRTAIRYCHRKGHKALVIHNGFDGLLEDSIFEHSWLNCDHWMHRGGSELGTRRTLPDINIDGVASKFEQHNIQALMIIGGFEAFNSLLILERERKYKRAFHIPMVQLPATISNNVPVTEYSLGSDTSLNVLVDLCDTISQSADASRNRVFVVETQGGECGYLATLGALATGASIVYTPEHGINLDSLKRDVDFLKARFLLNEIGRSEGRLVIRNEKASPVYTTELLTNVLNFEGGKIFDARSASLGHTLQGGIPSPIDRVRAVRLSIRTLDFIEHHHELLRRQPPESRMAFEESAAVITVQSSSIKWVPVKEMEKQADMRHRRGKHEWWLGLKTRVDALAGQPN